MKSEKKWKWILEHERKHREMQTRFEDVPVKKAVSNAGQLNAIQDACEQEIHKWEENEEELRDNPNASTDYELLQGRAEFAKQISDYLNEEE